MQPNRKFELHPVYHSEDAAEKLSANPQRYPKRLFDKVSVLKQQQKTVKQNSAYISDLITVQSLLNIRAVQSWQRQLHSSPSFDDRIIINVCGDRYETHRTTLELYPNTLLGDRKRRSHYYDRTRGEYFFDRNRSCFEAILYYYQSRGRIRRPSHVPIDVFLQEVSFFQLGSEALKQIRKDEDIEELTKISLPKSRFRQHLWVTLEYPDYSILAKIVNICSLFMILLSTVALAVESLPQYADLSQIVCSNLSANNTNNTANNSNMAMNVLNNDDYMCYSYVTSPFFVIQTVCVGFFTCELTLRIISAPSFLGFVKNILNWIDVSAVVPYYVTIIVYYIDRQQPVNRTTVFGLRILRVLRFVRILKFYRIFRSIKSLRALGSTIKESLLDLFIMINILTLLSFVFGAAAFFAENDTNSQAFDSIIKATYWGVITITTVGYGDIIPITPIGRIIACLCGLCGAITIGMLVSILVDRYHRVFARKLYINEDVVDFDELSVDENSDIGSRNASSQLQRHDHLREIGDQDQRAECNSAFEKDEQKTLSTINTSASSDMQVIGENSMNETNNIVHFIIGYIDSRLHEKSRDLLDTISRIVAQKQNAGENIEFNVVSNETQQAHRYDVKFNITFSSDEESNDDDTEELTEISNDQRKKGNVLKRFSCPSSSTSITQTNDVKKAV